jgi:hypothetical protein
MTALKAEYEGGTMPKTGAKILDTVIGKRVYECPHHRWSLTQTLDESLASLIAVGGSHSAINIKRARKLEQSSHET